MNARSRRLRRFATAVAGSDGRRACHPGNRRGPGRSQLARAATATPATGRKHARAGAGLDVETGYGMQPTLLRPLATPRPITRFVYRGLVLGLLGASALMLAAIMASGVTAHPTTAPDEPPAAIVDVSWRRAASDGVIALLGLARGDRVVAIDDVPATGDRVVDAWRVARPGGYLDLTVADGAGRLRRVLVVVHP